MIGSAASGFAASTVPLSASALAVVGVATIITTFGGIGLVVVVGSLIALKIRGH